MKPAEYNALVSRLEAEAARAPERLRLRVRLLVALGYGYVLAILGTAIVVSLLLVLALLTGTATVAALKLLIVVAPVTFLIARSLWIRIGIPEGIALPRGAAPVLEARVREIRRALRAPRVDTILLTDQFNAAVTQVPRLGIFGAPRTYLMLGLPLLYALGPRQFDAVLAHEFGHLSGAHPKLGLWVHRVGGVWNMLLQQLEQSRSWGKGLFERFFKWYVPRLNAYGFVMSRRDEYAADADAARVTSPEAMGEALVALELRAVSYTRYFWPRVWERAEHEPQPPATSWSLLTTAFRGNDDAPERQVALRFGLRRRSIPDDTHPSLRERLHALGLLRATGAEGTGEVTEEVQRLIVPVEHTAAEHYLGEVARERIAAWESRWRGEVGKNWGQRHHDVKASRARMAELKGRLEQGPELTPQEMWELADRSADVDGIRASAAFLRRAAEMDPKNAVSRFLLGRALLEDGDEAGLPLLREAMAIDPEAVPMCEMLIRSFAAGMGDRDAVRQADERLHALHASQEAARAERQTVTPQDALISAGISEADLLRMADLVRSVQGVKEVWIARKKVRQDPTRPFYVILFHSTFAITIGNERLQRLTNAILQGAAFDQAADVIVVSATGHGWLRDRMKAAGATRIGPHGRIESGRR